MPLNLTGKPTNKLLTAIEEMRLFDKVSNNLTVGQYIHQLAVRQYVEML